MGNTQANCDLKKFRVKQLKSFIVSNGGGLPKNEHGVEVKLEKHELIAIAERIQDVVAARPVEEGEIPGGFKEEQVVFSMVERVSPNDDSAILQVGGRGLVVGAASDREVNVKFDLHGDTVWAMEPFNLACEFPPTESANRLTASITKILGQNFENMDRHKLEKTREDLRRKCQLFEMRKGIAKAVSARTEELKILREEGWEDSQREWDKMTRARPNNSQRYGADAKTKTCKHTLLTAQQKTRDVRKKVKILEAQLADAKAELAIAEAEQTQREKDLAAAEAWAQKCCQAGEDYETRLQAQREEVNRRRIASKQASIQDSEWDKALEELESAVSGAGVKASRIQSQLGYTTERSANLHLTMN